MALPLRPGDPAPDFELPASGGGRRSLRSLRGRNVVLYFYPKDGTPGCTLEACAFARLYRKFQRRGAVVLGVSPDGLKRHAAFIAKFDLPFELLSDEDHAVCERYGVWVEKQNYGRKYMGVRRSTFLIDAQGRIARIWSGVRPKGHAEEVLGAL